MPLPIAYSSKVCYEPFIIAVAKVFFAGEGVRVEPRLVKGGPLNSRFEVAK